MAMLTFYGIDETDRQRFTEMLAKTKHTYELFAEPLSLTNSNPDAEVISIFASNNVTRALIEHMPKLKLIATRSTGFDHIDLQAAEDHDISVVTVPRYGEQTVAEFTFALLLGLSRKLVSARQSALDGHIDIQELQGFDLFGKTFGIIGTGHIGQHVAEIARGFGMKIIAHDAYPNDAAAKEIGFGYVSLHELAAQSDIISLHTPSTPETHHLVDKAFLERVKSRCVLINTARGELVDTTALVQALGSHKLAGAALDVMERETLLHETAEAIQAELSVKTAQAIVDILALKAMPNVILTPHVAFNTSEAVDRIRQTTVQNIIDFYDGATPNIVRK
ncbi:MAG: NAD(P)-dependent oxidoreductase [Candidatus Saccharibacteria bacterium]